MMMEDSAIWQAGIGITVLVAQGTLVRWIIVRLREDRDSSGQRDAELHHRINGVKDDYVRRDDLMGHISRLEVAQTTMNDGLNRVHERLDRLLSLVAQPPPKGD